MRKYGIAVLQVDMFVPFRCSGKQKIVQTILTNEEEEIGKVGIRLWPGPGSPGGRGTGRVPKPFL